MAKSLLDRVRLSRQSTVKVGAWEFTTTRPTDMDMLEISGKITQASLLQRFVVGWANVSEADIYPGGTGQPAEFSTELFAEWVADKPDLWNPLTDAIIGSYRAHKDEVEDSAKNLPPG